MRNRYALCIVVFALASYVQTPPELLIILAALADEISCEAAC